MDFFTWCMITAGFAMAIAAIGTGLAQGGAIRSALDGVARNPETSGKILTTMMIGLAMIESLAIYVFVISMIILFANPFTEIVVEIMSK